MSKNQIIALLICVLVVVLAGFAIVSPIFQGHWDAKICIFADMAECESLEDLSVGEGRFTRYHNTALDDKLNGLQYTSFFSGSYSCDQFEFEIFAYKFVNANSAKTYFENVTGKNSDSRESNFSLVSGAVRSHIAVFSGDSAYAAYFPTSALTNVLEILSKQFTIQIN